MRTLLLALGCLLIGCATSEPSSASSSGSMGGGSSSSSGTGGGDASAWRSALYPESWTPSFTDSEGRFFHDFSYAGYHNGEVEPGAPSSALVLDVVAAYGADSTGTTDATPSVAQALSDAEAMGGAVVFFPEGLYRFDGVLSVHAPFVVLRGAGPEKSRLFFTKSSGMSDAAHIQFSANPTTDTEVPLSRDAAPRERVVEVDDAGTLAAGDDIAVGWVISPEFVEEHGMTGTWQAFNGTWQPFFRRTVVTVDRKVVPNRIELDVPIRYPAKLRDQASVRRYVGLLRECGVESLGVSNAVDWDAAWTVTRTHAIEIRNAKDCWVRDVASFPSPVAPPSGPGASAHLVSGGVLITDAKRVTVADTHLGFAQNRGDGGNGYIFEVQRGSEILFRDCSADAGRHNFIQNWGFGTTGCVFLRVESRNGSMRTSKDDDFEWTGLSEFHHSLALANLIDSSTFDDGFSIVNRNGESTGAGHTGTQNVLWNLKGTGTLRSLQFGTGYVIGTQGLYPVTESPLPMGVGTAPVDYVEGLEQGDTLEPASLYEDQRAKRLAH